MYHTNQKKKPTWSQLSHQTLSLQFIMTLCILSREIRHAHHLDDQTRPAGEMLCALSPPRVRIVLLPRKTRPLPFIESVHNKIFAELRI